MEYLFVCLVLILLVWGYFEDSKPTEPEPKPKPKPEYKPTKHKLFNDSTEILDLLEAQPEQNPIKSEGNQFMPAEDKAAYLRSAEWFDLRAEVMARDNYKCTSCGTPHLLECHHISYENLGAESLDQLTILCRSCHQEVHNRLGYDRKTIFI